MVIKGKLQSAMPTLREAFNSEKLTPCWTVVIFSFMVAFTLSILDLAVNLTDLHLPVVIMWMVTVTSVLFTAVYWCYQNSSFKRRLKEGSCMRFGREKDFEKRSLSPRHKEGYSEEETANYGMESTTRITQGVSNE